MQNFHISLGKIIEKKYGIVRQRGYTVFEYTFEAIFRALFLPSALFAPTTTKQLLLFVNFTYFYNFAKLKPITKRLEIACRA
jgi:hypothetical protein